MSLPRCKFELEFNHGSEYSDEEHEALLSVLRNSAPSCGPEVLGFESDLAGFTGTNYAIAVGNCTSGLEIAIKACMLAASTDRDEVIVPTVSWISTASSAALAGAVVKFADVVDPTVCVDVSSIKHLVSDRTAVVVVVHLYGRPVDGCAELALWLRDRGIYLVEDCAHALGAVDVSGRMCGSIGDIGIYSFHQQKNMTTLGEGGACVTNSASLRESMVGLRSLCAMSYDPKGKYLSVDVSKFPMEKRYWFMDFSGHGHNYRMTDVQAAVGRVQLRKLKTWNARRSEIARKLHEKLGAVHPGLRPAALDGPIGIDSSKFVHAWHIFHVLITETFPVPKDQFMWILLQEFGIKTWNHYLPMHLASSFRADGLGRPGDCPVAEALFEQYVSLPLHPRLTDAAIDYMITAIQEISTRSYVPRISSTPLLSALVDFTDPRKSLPYVIDSESIVSKQWDMFESQVVRAGEQYFFSSGDPIYVSRAPGRLDLMGGNDDYTGGLVFECTIAEATFCAASRNSSDKIVVRNRQLDEKDIEVPLSVLLQACSDHSTAANTLSEYIKLAFPGTRWQLYVFGVLLWLQIRFPDRVFHNLTHNSVCGVSLLIWTEVPLNRGVSSSASVEVAVMKASAKAFGIELSGELLATACQWAENSVCSSACGLMDQMAVTLGTPFMTMRCQPAIIFPSPPLPSELAVYAIDSGVSHEVSGIEYEAARAAAFMGYKIICSIEGVEIEQEMTSGAGEIPRFIDKRFNGYLANINPSKFSREYESKLPVSITGDEFLRRFGMHVDPATPVLPEYNYRVRANTRYAVLENNRVTLFSQLLRGCMQNVPSDSMSQQLQGEVYAQLGELMYQSHDSYTECGLGSQATTLIVDLVRSMGAEKGLFGAKITGGGAGGTVAILGLKSAESSFQEVVGNYAKARGLSQPPYVFVGTSFGADAFGIKELNI